MHKKKTLLLLIVFLAGTIIPFTPALVVIEMFYLLIPFGIITIVSLIYLMASIFDKRLSTQKALYIFSILPVFILSQLVSGFIVDKVQRFRSTQIISEIQRIEMETGVLPKTYVLSMGIQYQRLQDKSSYIIKYSRGFMVTEKYQSKTGEWNSYR